MRVTTHKKVLSLAVEKNKLEGEYLSGGFRFKQMNIRKESRSWHDSLTRASTIVFYSFRIILGWTTKFIDWDLPLYSVEENKQVCRWV